MNSSQAIQVIPFVWLALGAYWTYSLMQFRPAKSAWEKDPSFLSLVCLLSSAYLLSSAWLPVPLLNATFRWESLEVDQAGTGATLIGVAFAIWGRRHLGQYWSGEFITKHGESILTSGPYAIVRHPIYAGILCAMAGTAIAYGQFRGLLAIGLAVMGFSQIIQEEEASLILRFGEEYERYRREVRAVIPFIL